MRIWYDFPGTGIGSLIGGVIGNRFFQEPAQAYSDCLSQGHSLEHRF